MDKCMLERRERLLGSFRNTFPSVLLLGFGKGRLEGFIPYKITQILVFLLYISWNIGKCIMKMR